VSSSRFGLNVRFVGAPFRAAGEGRFLASFTLVYCDLRDCLFYDVEPTNEKKCRCSHPDKPHHMTNVRCPLYRIDWQKQSGNLEPPRPRRRRGPG
jgi:hypothetical protein